MSSPAPEDPLSEWSRRWRLFLGALPFGYCLAQDILDLPVETPQLIGRPFLQIVPQIGRYPQEKWFSFLDRHRLITRNPRCSAGRRDFLDKFLGQVRREHHDAPAEAEHNDPLRIGDEGSISSERSVPEPSGRGEETAIAQEAETPPREFRIELSRFEVLAVQSR